MNRETQIPIYRAKNIDSDEYVEGFYMTQDYVGEFEKVKNG